SARRGNPVVGHRVGGIAIWPGAPRHGLHQGGGTQITQICTQMDADGFLHRMGESARALIGTALLWVPRAVALRSPWPPHPARRSSAVPPPHNMGRGTGGEANATGGFTSPSQYQSPHRTTELRWK